MLISGLIGCPTGAQYLCHYSNGSAPPALLWVYAALERRR